jgi:type IX secretion system PorP/SprF family membrane protein
LHRSQWVGVNGAPTTQTLNIEDKIVGNLGGSLNISKDAIGPLSEVLFDVNISYAVQLNSMGKLAFGLKAGGRLLDIDLNKGNLRDYQSPATTNVKDGEFSPVLGAGLYYYTDRGYLGVSASNLLKNNYYDNDSGSNLDNSHFYLIGGYVFDLSESLKFKPAMMVKAVVGAPYSFDFSANFMYQERLVMGAAYRYNAAVSGLLGIYVTKQFFVGYAYDYDLELNQNISGGSHEIFLGLRFSLDKSYESPRFF